MSRKKSLWYECFPTQRLTKPKLRKPLSKMSPRRKKDNVEYRKVKKVWKVTLIESGLWFCRRCGGVPSDHPHHWAGRRSNLCKVEYFRASCDACNIFAKNHPAEARREGWIAPVGVYKV